MIYLVRHGQTEFNLARRHQGHVDSPLTALGREQACRVGDTLAGLRIPPETLIVSSPLGRALQTARLVALSAGIDSEILLDPDLMEIGMGSWEGLTEVEIAERWPNRQVPSTREGMSFHSPDGESLDELASRVDRVLHRIAGKPQSTHILVSHGITGRVLRARYLGLDPTAAFDLEAPQDSFYRLGERQVTDIACAE